MRLVKYMATATWLKCSPWNTLARLLALEVESWWLTTEHRSKQHSYLCIAGGICEAGYIKFVTLRTVKCMAGLWHTKHCIASLGSPDIADDAIAFVHFVVESVRCKHNERLPDSTGLNTSIISQYTDSSGNITMEKMCIFSYGHRSANMCFLGECEVLVNVMFHYTLSW